MKMESAWIGRRKKGMVIGMEQYIIKGGAPLKGEVTISGAKNAALGILAAAVMSDDDVLIEILPDYLKSASMTAEWENQLLEMEHGKIQSEQFLTGIRNLITMMLNGCDQISEDESGRFQSRESIGTCPVCGSLVYEGKKNFYCSSRECNFALWKETRYLQSMRKTIDKKMAAELLKNGSTHIKDLYSAKKDRYFEADLLMKTEDGKVIFSLSFPKNKTNRSNKKTKKRA